MEGLVMKYFVLKPKGTDAYAEASKNALQAYADSIRGTNDKLADDLDAWVRRESFEAARIIHEREKN